jgi:predicted flap endonuclease-1-like 5' DNA nuclease
MGDTAWSAESGAFPLAQIECAKTVKQVGAKLPAKIGGDGIIRPVQAAAWAESEQANDSSSQKWRDFRRKDGAFMAACPRS